MAVVYFLIGGFLRRWYGGGFSNTLLGNNRSVQTCFMLTAFMTIYLFDFSSWQNWLGATVLSCWLQFQFWSRGHGCCFDIGRDVNPADVTIKRYNERWYHIPCDFLLSNNKYGFLYDFIYMGLRYTCPMLPLMFIDLNYFIIGALVSPIYSFFWTLFEKEKWVCENKVLKFISADHSTAFAEWVVGGVVFAGCYMIGG